MIKLPSLTGDYTLIFSGDPALELPVVPKLDDDATDEQKAEAKKVSDERERLLKVARDTGNWDALIKSGEKPTLFQMHQLNKMARDFIEGEAARKNLAPAEFSTLLFRLAIKRIDNFEGVKVEHDRQDGFLIAKTETVNSIAKFGTIGSLIIAEISAVAAVKTYQPLDPLP